MRQESMPPSTDRLLKPAQVADILGISLRMVRDRIQRRELPAVKIGRWNMVKESDLRAYIASRPPR